METCRDRPFCVACLLTYAVILCGAQHVAAWGSPGCVDCVGCVGRAGRVGCVAFVDVVVVAVTVAAAAAAAILVCVFTRMCRAFSRRNFSCSCQNVVSIACRYDENNN